MLRLRPLAVLLSLALALCLLGLWSARSQTGALRRVTNTTDDGVNVNPSLSGDGRRIAFESTKDLAGAGGNGFHALRADLSSDPAAFVQMGVTRAPAPGISQDGSIIAFASKDNPLGTNPDGNSEIYLFNGATLRQITNTTPATITERTRQGNFQPSLSDDGRFIAFSSNRNLNGQNADGNFEIFIFDTASSAFAQLTNTSGAVGAIDAKISGNGTRVAYIRDTNALPAAQRDLVLQDRAGSTTRILASNVTNLAFTYGRAISDDGLRVVYSADIATNSSQVFLFDGRTTNTTRQITSLGERELEVPLHPTISGDGTRIAFATRRPVPITGTNGDNSIEVYTFDIPTGQFGRVTNVTSGVADGFDGSLRAAEVVSSLNDDGSIIAFNFPRTLSDDVDSQFDNNSEIYTTGTAPRPTVGTLQILNGASFGNEPATTEAVAPDSVAVARGGALSFTTEQTQRQADGSFPRNVGGTTVTVNGRSAQIFFVSPQQINFHVPAETEIGTAEVIVTNVEGFQSRGTIQVLRGAPGIFTISGDGLGEGMILNADTLQPGPFDPSSGQLRLIIFATGVRKATQVTATAGGRALTVESVTENPNMPGMDEVRVLVPADLRGVGPVDLVIRADNRDSNPVTIIFAGPCSDIVVNEVLADPPDGIAGDANRDGVRDSAQDEFIELVNRSGVDKDISGYQLTARSTSTSTDTVRHTFAPGTIFASGTAIVIFGGGGSNFNPADPAFGGALVLKASSGSLSLTNAGGVITLREPSQTLVTVFSYGGSTGLNGDANQSLTRSPDAGVNPSCPGFRLHSTAPDSGGRLFSPGTRVNGTPFTAIPIARIEVLPATATIDNGAKQQFTATAYDASGNPIPGVIFFWQSSNEAVATIDQTGLATSLSPGMTEIRASARGVQSAPAILTVREVVRVLTSVEVTPNPATVPVGGTQQFTARGLDQFGNEITGLTFTWESTNTNVATIDSATGLTTALSQGQTTIRATSQGVTGTATLNVTAPTVIINEVLADPPGSATTDLQGDANRDGVRSASDDEFVELVNSTSASINLSGWTLRTRATTGTTETARHTFTSGTTLAAGNAIVVFGGAGPNFDPANPLFGCAQVVLASSGGLSLTNGGLTIVVRDGSGNLVTQFTYGGSTGLNADGDQSLTRSPDITGGFVQHLAAAGADGRRFSPGVKVNGTPFGNCPARLTSITISPLSASILVGQTQQFTAQAFDQFGQFMTGVTITFASDNTAVATIGAVTTDPGTGIATVIVTGQTAGTAHITATATDGTTTITSSQATLTVNATAPTTNLTINDVTQNEGNAGTTTFTFTVNLSAPAPAGGVTFDIATADGTAQDDNPATEDNDYVARSLTGQTIPVGQQSYTFDVSVNGDTVVETNETFLVNVTNVIGANVTDGQGTGTITNDDAPPASTVVISQVYGGGGNTGAPFNADFIELFNRGTSAVDITGWSVQYSAATSTTGTFAVTPICPVGTCSIPAGGYFLVKEAGGATGASFTADVTGTINLAATGGKVALATNTTPLSAAASCVTLLASVVDFVGYGSANCFEGTAPTTAPSNTTAAVRKSGGCQDTNDNAADFLVTAPTPRNSSFPVNDCTAPPTPNITINDVTVTEGNSGTINATFTVTLSAASTSTVTVDFATADGTATAGSDYQSNSGTLTFMPGQTTQTIDVAVIGDTTDEPSETFFINLTNAANGVILDNQGQGTITDNDAQPTLSINDTTIAEGNSGTTNATFTVTLSAASGFTVTVNYATADGTATTAGSDYQSTNGTLSFTPGQTTQTITVLVNGDTTFEPDETFFVNLTTPANATILDTQGQGTITNDDAAPPVPAITINDVSVTEGNSGTKTVDITVSLSMNPTTPVTVDYATANGTATSGSDYQSTSGTLTFNPGTTSLPVTVTINGDTLVEPDETFFVNLSNASVNAVLTDAQGTGTITNDDAANVVVSQVYGGGGNSGATFTHDFIEIFNRGTTTVDLAGWSVQYNAATGTGTWTITQLCPTGPCLLAPGQYFLVQEATGGAVGNPLPTPDAIGTIAMAAGAGKVALVNTTTALSGACPSSASIIDLVGYGTTANCFEGSGPAPAPSATNADFRKVGGCQDTNDNAADFLTATPSPRNSSSPLNDCSAVVTPNISINDVAVTEGNSGTVTATFTVSLSSPAPAGGVTFDIATADGTATIANSDYVTKSQTGQTIAAGQQTFMFTVTVNGDTAVEPDETFLVNLTNVVGANVTDGQGQGTIQNDDSAPLPTLSINDVTQTEGSTGTTTFTFTVSLSAVAPAGGVTFDIATADGTAQDDNPATEDNDYVAQSLTTQTIPAGQQTYTFNVAVNGDTNVETDETFFVNVTNVTGATIADGQGQGTIQNDDAVAFAEDEVVINEFVVNPTTGKEYVELLVTKPGGVDLRGWTLSDVNTRAGSTSGTEGDITLPSLAYLSNVPQGTFVVVVVTTPSGNSNTLTEDLDTTDGNRKLVLIAGTTTGLVTAGTFDISGDENIQLYVPGGRATARVVDQVLAGGSTAYIFAPDGTTVQANWGDNSTATTSDNINGGSTVPANSDISFCPTADTLAEFQNNDTGTRFTRTASSYGTPGARNSCVTSDTSVGGTGVLPTLSISDAVPVTEGNTGTTTTATFTVTLSASSADTVTVQYATADVTATAGSDYVGRPLTTLTFNPGETSKTIDVTVNGDALDDANETFNVNLSNPSNATISDGQGVGTITDDDNAPTISINDPAAVAEGAGGTTTTITFDVTLSAASGQTVTVNYATANGTAVAGATAGTGDYDSTSGTLTFNPGVTSLPVTVTVNGDNADEPDTETFNVILTSPGNATVLDNTGVGTITDDDPLPSLAINDPAAVTEGNAGTKTITFTVTLTGATDRQVTVDYATADDTATTANSDYVATNGTLTFAPGVTTQTFDVTINGDTTIEPDETFFVNLTLPVGSPATISDAQGVGTITNDDAATPTFSIESKAVTEGTGPNTVVNYTVTVSPTSTGTVTVDYTIASGTATVGLTGASNVDATAASLTGTLTFGAGVATQGIPVTIIGDSIDEPNETFTITLSNPSPGTAISGAAGTGTETITDDDDPPTADLSITKTDSLDPVPSGANLTYSLTVTNNSAATSQTVTVTDNLPAELVFVSCTSVSGNGTCGGTGNNRTVTFTSIAGNSSETITLVARVLHSAAGTTISNTASVASATTPDPVSGNNSATQTTAVILPSLAISYVYGGGGANTGTPSYTRDFVEIFNRGTVPITLSGLSLQQGATTGNIGGNAGQIYTLCPGGAATCTLNPGQYYLVETGTTGTAGAPLSATVTPDDTGGTLTFGATNGKAALVTGTTGLACGATATPCSAAQLARVVDLVGYGTGTTQAEGNSPTGNLSTTTAARRKASGCTDTNVNSADFDIVTPTAANAPRNMASALNVCPP